MRTLALVAVAALGTACALGASPSQLRTQAEAGDARKVAKTAELAVEVSDPDAAKSEVERIVAQAGGLIERSTATKDANVSIQCRVPAAQLDSVMDAVAELGSEENRSVTAVDVTDQYTDLDTRLRNDQALRGRLQELLSRAKDVQDVLAIEKELTRIQSEIETLQAQLDRLKTEVALSGLSVSLERKHVLGPLGYLGYGLVWGISKLFILW